MQLVYNALIGPTPFFLFLQLECFTWDRANCRQVKCRHTLAHQLLQEEVRVPSCHEARLREYMPVPYVIHAALLHHGASPQEGRYTVLLRCHANWVHRDDERVKTYATAPGSTTSHSGCLLLASSEDG